MGPISGQSLTKIAGACLFAALSLPQPAWAADPVNLIIGFDTGRLLVLSALAAGAVALAIAASLWALAEQRNAGRLRRALKAAATRNRSQISERDALLTAGREALVIWSQNGATSLSYGGGEEKLKAILRGPDGAVLTKALDDLASLGAGFRLSLSDVNGKKFTARGRAVGALAAVWLGEPQGEKAVADFRAILDALPIPVWLRDKGLALSWANHAFLTHTGAASIEAARAGQSALDKSERDLAATARSQNTVMEAKRFAVVNGQRRAITFTEIPLGDAGIIGTAVDMTDVAAAEAKLQQHVDAHVDTLDKLATAVAIFSKEQKLTFFNRAFVRLWGLPEEWLERHPSDGEILDRLRDARKLPEQRDYQGWKKGRLALYQAAGRTVEEFWHIPGGKTLRVVSQPHPFGGLTFLYEDVSERLNLESNYNTLVKVQSATLDTLNEGVAVFGPDGKLKLHNAAFARIWDLKPEELQGEPHARVFAGLSAARFGDSAIWDRLIQAIVSEGGAARELGEMERSDRTILSLHLSPLPDGATLVTFANVTDRFRIETALRDRNDALEAADRLKSDFIKHVSYELRTPLSTIMGFAEHLASGVPGGLNARQQEYVEAIVSGSTTLKELVNDILDLALVESGALRLELERLDLYGLLADVANHAGDWAAKSGVTLELDCTPGAGLFLADPKRMRQVVFNLLSNAFKFTPRDGVVKLSGRIVNDDVQIAVADNGPGLSPEVKANVFERFAAKSRSGTHAGAGLGLALVNRFVELHDGWVEIESEKGTLVRCHIPRRIPASESPREKEK
ncbi:MAG TPA: PAS-domain containing protein, partial [Rhizomicrobium sp.]|nr:PAS-domain containing protein [Rhizomicrobium sp.]